MKTKPILITLILGVAAIISFIYLSKSNESSLEPNKVVPVSIGNTIVNINIYGKQPPRIVFFNMHDNENTAVEAGKEIIQNYGGYLVELAGTGERLISFSLDDQKYTFDPNRIYTENGVKKTLERYSQYSEAAHREIRRFVDTLFQYLFIDDMKIMVALHNNTEERYSLESYMPGGSYETDASRYYKNPDSDIDDFYFITDSTFFEFFKSIIFLNEQFSNRTVPTVGISL